MVFGVTLFHINLKKNTTFIQISWVTLVNVVTWNKDSIVLKAAIGRGVVVESGLLYCGGVDLSYQGL